MPKENSCHDTWYKLNEYEFRYSDILWECFANNVVYSNTHVFLPVMSHSLESKATERDITSNWCVAVKVPLGASDNAFSMRIEAAILPVSSEEEEKWNEKINFCIELNLSGSLQYKYFFYLYTIVDLTTSFSG